MTPHRAAATKRGWRAISNNGRPPCRSDGAGFGASTPANGHRDQRDRGLHHKAEGEQIRRPDIHGPLHELRTKHAREHTARHHPGDGLRPVRHARAIGGGEAVGLRHRAIESAEEGRGTEQPERIVQDRP